LNKNVWLLGLRCIGARRGRKEKEEQQEEEQEEEEEKVQCLLHIAPKRVNN